ncbi:MAG: energy-coupling factor transporter transmembrane component T [Corynebacterium sp.]|nr:energy-coupling factor transporter transmembrane component T [Corynebacterium sp.]
MNEQRLTPHPLVLLLMPFPAIGWILLAKSPAYPLLIVHICAFGVALLGWRTALKIFASTLGVFLFIFLSFWFWIGTQPAAMLALRMASLLMLFYTALKSVNWPVLIDTLIDQFMIPYPLVDALAMSGRFTALMQREYRNMRTQLRVNTGGSLWKQALTSHKLIIPLLVAAFRHADTTALALENRQFASSNTRTTHYQQHVTWKDWFTLGLGWLGLLLLLPKLIAMMQ